MAYSNLLIPLVPKTQYRIRVCAWAPETDLETIEPTIKQSEEASGLH